MRLQNIVQKCLGSRLYLDSRLTEKQEAIADSNANAFIKKFVLDTEHNLISKQMSLYGLTFAVKDNFCIRNELLTMGMDAAHIDKICPDDAALIKVLKKQGAFLAGTTNMDICAIGSSGINKNYGNMVNPLDQSYPIGGSSGGSALAVATGLVDFSLGTDSGGSIRIPAAACGLYGFKFSPGQIDSSGIALLDQTIDSAGIICRDNEDLTYLLNSILGSSAEQNDFTFLIPSAHEINEECSYEKEIFIKLLSSKSLPFKISEIKEDVGFTKYLNLRKIIISFLFQDFIQRFEIDKNALSDEARAILIFADSLDKSEYQKAKFETEALNNKVNKLLSAGAYLLTPASELNKELSHPALNRYLALANICELPALSFPYAFGPFKSLQIIGQKGSDLSLSKALKILKPCLDILNL